MRELPQVELGEICIFQNGRAFKKNEWRSSGLPIIRIQNLNKIGADFNYFDGEYDKKIEVNNDDLLFSWSGTVGSSFGPHIWRRGKGVLNQHIFKVGLSKDIDCLYAFYVLRFVTAEIEKNVKGAVGLRHVTKSDLNKFKIPLPDLGEQKRIVAILDEAFAGIDTAIANTEKNLANARELFDGYLNSIINQYKDEFEKHRLGDSVYRLTNGYVGATRNIYIDEGVPYLLARHVKNNVLAFDGKTYISDEFNQKNKKSILKEGDVLLVQSGHIGHSAVVPKEHAGHNCHAMIVITPKELLLGEYLSIYFNTSDMKSHFQKIRSGSTVPHLTCKLVKEIEIPVPTLEKQGIIIEQYKNLLVEIERLEKIYQQKINSLKELKQSLLQKAFSGELTAEGDKLMDEAVA